MKNIWLALNEYPVCLYINKVCMPEINTSHGTNDAFSTGSQAQ